MRVSFSEFYNRITKLIKPDKKIYIIGIAGGSGSGKSFIAKKISESFPALIIRMDDYYVRGKFKDNKDIPEALNLELIKQNLVDLKKGKEIEKPVYTFGLHKDSIEKIKAKSVIILDGIFALNSLFINQLDFKIFVDAEESIRLSRRITRDIDERGFTKEHVLKRWSESVQPMYLKYVLPQKEKADLIIENN